MRFAIIPAIAVLWTNQLQAQDTTQSPAPSIHSFQTSPRDPTTAAILGTLVPGAGHVYSTEYLRGAGLFAATGSLLGMGEIIYVLDRCTFAFLSAEACDPGPQWPHRTLGTLLIAGGVGMWIVSAFDAPRAARRFSARHDLHSTQWKPLVEPRRDNKSGVNVGLAVAW